MKKSIVLWKNWEKWGKSHENYMFSGGWPPNRQQRLNMNYMNQYTCSDRKGTTLDFTKILVVFLGTIGYHWIPHEDHEGFKLMHIAAC